MVGNYYLQTTLWNETTQLIAFLNLITSCKYEYLKKKP